MVISEAGLVRFAGADIKNGVELASLVDIWHCDKDGIYAGYAGQPRGVSTVGQTFLRGIQMTDANGQRSFISICPGWYPSRVTRVHFKVSPGASSALKSRAKRPISITWSVPGAVAAN